MGISTLHRAAFSMNPLIWDFMMQSPIKFPYCQALVSMFYINSKGKHFRHSVGQSDPSCQQKWLLPWPGGCRCHLRQPNPFGRRFVFDDSRQLEWARIKQWGPSSFCYITRVNWLRKSVAQVCPRWHNNQNIVQISSTYKVLLHIDNFGPSPYIFLLLKVNKTMDTSAV